MANDIETLQSILKSDPSNFQARRELSILLVNNGFNEEAEGNLEYLLKYFPDDAEILYNLGIVYEKLKKIRTSKRLLPKSSRNFTARRFLLQPRGCSRRIKRLG